jgi:hypothetical protein
MAASTRIPFMTHQAYGPGGRARACCTNPLAKGIPAAPRETFTMTAACLPWHLNLSSFCDGVAAGTISHMQVQLAGPSCRAVIDGTSGTASDGHVRFRYADATGRLAVLAAGGNLHFFGVQGCAGVIHTGDPATIRATFTVSPPQAISSP